MAILRDDVVPLLIILAHHELEVELQQFYVEDPTLTYLIREQRKSHSEEEPHGRT